MKLEELVGKKLTEAQFDEAAGKKDACYHKVKARYDVWPSAYASGALVKCRKAGAANWGNKSKKESKNEMKRMGAYARVLKKLKDKEKKKKSKKEGVYEKNKGKTLYGKDLVNYFVKRFKYSTRDATAVANKLKDVGFKVPKVLPFNESVNEGPQKDRNELALHMIELNKMLANAKILAKKDPKAKRYIKLLQQDIKDAKNKMTKIKNESIEESYDIWNEDGSFGYTMTGLIEAEYGGRKVKLGKPMQGDVKKFKVYVKNDKGNVVKVNFGHGGSSAKGKTMKIRKSNPKARKSFRARHNCDNPGPRHKARYWSCRKW